MIVPAPNIVRNCGIRPAGFRESSSRGASGAARGRGRHSRAWMGRRWFGIGGESDWLRGPSQRWRHRFSLAGEDIHTGGTFDRRRSRVRRYGHVTRGAGSSGQGSEAQFGGALRAVRDGSAGLQARGREMERKAFVSLLPLVCGLIVFRYKTMQRKVETRIQRLLSNGPPGRARSVFLALPTRRTSSRSAIISSARTTAFSAVRSRRPSC